MERESKVLSSKLKTLQEKYEKVKREKLSLEHRHQKEISSLNRLHSLCIEEKQHLQHNFTVDQAEWRQTEYDLENKVDHLVQENRALRGRLREAQNFAEPSPVSVLLSQNGDLEEVCMKLSSFRLRLQELAKTMDEKGEESEKDGGKGDNEFEKRLKGLEEETKRKEEEVVGLKERLREMEEEMRQKEQRDEEKERLREKERKKEREERERRKINN
uniref:Uncharacterized protein n=1 Tax=Paramoeba aestuarina TaxID=180227 RepID=A0A6U2X543_9EUKA|mmetsp:Transcript_174/g.340  ORF Transcript_174/g.340 Transcript_174/m.340 type:complete len:216 (+) Transcript_174:114-761(+)